MMMIIIIITIIIIAVIVITTIVINFLFIKEKKDFFILSFQCPFIFPHFQYKTFYCKLYF